MIVSFNNIIVKQITTSGYNHRVRSREFQIEDLLLQRADIRKTNSQDGKLATNWEGPYRMQVSSGKEAYLLESIEGYIYRGHGISLSRGSIIVNDLFQFYFCVTD